MKIFKKSLLLILLAVTNSAFAKSAAIQVVQKFGSESVIYNASYLIEQTVMDYFFENNFIISNSPVINQKKGQDISIELQKAFDAALGGSLEYLIQADVYYNLQDSNNPEEALLSNLDKIEWKVTAVDSKKLIASGKATPGKKYKNDETGLCSFSNELAKHIIEQIEIKGGKK